MFCLSNLIDKPLVWLKGKKGKRQSGALIKIQLRFMFPYHNTLRVIKGKLTLTNIKHYGKQTKKEFYSFFSLSP